MIDTSVQNYVHRTIPITNLLRAQFSPGRIALPVQNQAIYARFKHVQGVPSTAEGQGFSMARLRMLDNLIDRLTRLEGSRGEWVQPDSGGEVEGLIEEYAARLHRAVETSEASGYSLGYGSGANELGTLLDMVA